MGCQYCGEVHAAGATGCRVGAPKIRATIHVPGDGEGKVRASDGSRSAPIGCGVCQGSVRVYVDDTIELSDEARACTLCSTAALTTGPRTVP